MGCVVRAVAEALGRDAEEVELAVIDPLYATVHRPLSEGRRPGVRVRELLT